MSEDAATHMKSRLRADLLSAMRAGRKLEVALIRELVAALDNAEAPSIQAGATPAVRHEFRRGSAEVERLILSRGQIHALLATEIEKRERAATELERVGESARADALRSQALMAKRYLE